VTTFSGLFLSADFNHNGRQLVTGDPSGNVVVWDAKSGAQSLNLKGHSDAVNDIAYSPDGRYIVSGSKDASVRLWDSRTGRQLSFARTKDPVE
jgi:WD40 repeat protein